ncbi:hypothetical protein AX774_g6094, partial [Zancudomyces culisetae]
MKVLVLTLILSSLRVGVNAAAIRHEPMHLRDYEPS